MDKPKQYFEGTLQLRNTTQEIIDFVADAVDKEDNVWIAKTKKVKNGIDLYLSSNKFLREIGRKLKNRFTGQLISTSSLFTRSHMTSKEVHRGCILFRHYNVKIGDVIDMRGDKIMVISIGNDILGKNLKTNKKVYVKFDQLR